ncbi:MAG: hypothetical protein WCG78_04905 [Candidatus Omnitrophota bacterium]
MHTSFLAYPFGLDLHTEYLAYVWMDLIYVLSIIMKPAAAYNFQVLLNFILCGVVTYAAVYHVTRSRFSALLSGITFAFCPYQFARSWQHLGLTYNELIPLSLFAAIMLKEERTRQNIIFFIMSLLLLFSFDFSIMYLGMIAVATFLVYVAAYNWRKKLYLERGLFVEDGKYFACAAIAGAVTFMIVLPQFLPMIVKSAAASPSAVASGFNFYHRPFNDLFIQSAKPLSYLLPATSHPVFGKFTEQFIGSSLYGVSYTEHALYLGWVPLALAFIAWRSWRRRGRSPDTRHQSPVKEIACTNDRFYIGFFVLLAIVAWAFSQPPYFTFPAFKIYMPSFFMYKILPMYRAYCRFGIVLMLAVAVLAGFGLKYVLARFLSRRVRIVVAGLACLLVLFEFFNFPPYKMVDLTHYPQVYNWLKAEKGEFAVAEYPLDTESPNEYYKFCQTIHEKKIINATMPGTVANKLARRMWRLSEPETAHILRWMGVRYVIVHLDAYMKSEDEEWVDESGKVKERRLPGLKLVQSYDTIDVYEVTALPKEPVGYE